jgi:hypothetical protein
VANRQAIKLTRAAIEQTYQSNSLSPNLPMM